MRHILLKKAGQAGFITKCSRRIRNSVNRVLTKNARPNQMVNKTDFNLYTQILIKRLEEKGAFTGSKGFVWRRNAKSGSGNK